MTQKEALKSWEAFNTYLRTASEREAAALLDAERTGARRLVYLLRAHAAMNKRRARRERDELRKLTTE